MHSFKILPTTRELFKQRFYYTCVLQLLSLLLWLSFPPVISSQELFNRNREAPLHEKNILRFVCQRKHMP